MLLHEVFEKAATSFLIFRDILLKRRYRHSAHVSYREDSGNLNAQGKPFDVAVEFPREKECGLQCRVHKIMLFNRNENGLETHGHLQFERLSGRTGERSCGVLAVSRATHGERSDGLSTIQRVSSRATSRLPDERIALLPLRGVHGPRTSRQL